MLYAFDYVPDDNGTLLVTSPDFPEITTFAESVPEVVSQALGALEEAVAARMNGGEAIPSPATADPKGPVGEPEDGSGRVWAKLPALTALKVELYNALRADAISRAELARRLDWNRESVDRLFRLDHRSRLEQLESAFAKLGREIKLDIRKAG